MQPKMPKTPFVMSLSGSAKETELRIRNIFQWKKKRPPIIAIVAAVLVVALCGSLVRFVPREEHSSNLIPGKIGVLAVEEVPGGLVYATGWFGSVDLYWLPDDSNSKDAKVLWKELSRVDPSSLTLTCEGNVLWLEYLWIDTLIEWDFHWDDAMKTLRYRVTGNVPGQYPMYNTLIELDFGRDNLRRTEGYRVAENMPPERVDLGGATVVE